MGNKTTWAIIVAALVASALTMMLSGMLEAQPCPTCLVNAKPPKVAIVRGIESVEGMPAGMYKVAQVPDTYRTIWVGFDLYTQSEGLEMLRYYRLKNPESRFCLVDSNSDLDALEQAMWLEIVRESNAKAGNSKIGFNYPGSVLVIEPNGNIVDIAPNVESE